MVESGLVLAIALPVILGLAAGYLTRSNAEGQWYASLKKPSWTPPKWLFGPVWAVLYVMMGYASWRVWKSGGRQEPMILYGIQLALNVAWSFMFFRAQNLSWALFDIMALLGVLSATVMSFYTVDHVAAYAMMPYLAWVSYATALTANIYLNNNGAK